MVSFLAVHSCWSNVTQSHVTSDTRSSHFSAYNIEKLGMGLGTRLYCPLAVFSEPNIAIMSMLEILKLKHPLISQYEVGDSLEHHPLIVFADKVDLCQQIGV